MIEAFIIIIALLALVVSIITAFGMMDNKDRLDAIQRKGSRFHVYNGGE